MTYAECGASGTGVKDHATGWIPYDDRYYNTRIGTSTQQDDFDAALEPANGNRHAGGEPVNNIDLTWLVQGPNGPVCGYACGWARSDGDGWSTPAASWSTSSPSPAWPEDFESASAPMGDPPPTSSLPPSWRSEALVRLLPGTLVTREQTATFAVQWRYANEQALQDPSRPL